jgi:hypothetical protein
MALAAVQRKTPQTIANEATAPVMALRRQLVTANGMHDKAATLNKVPAKELLIAIDLFLTHCTHRFVRHERILT